MVIENWSILSREIVESLSLDKFKSWLDKVLSNLL